jgi:predicted nucleic acid-binding protein
VTRYLLDTNVIGGIIKPEPPPALLAWLEAQADDDLYIASPAVAEIRRGILDKPASRRRAALDAWFAGPEGPQVLSAGRILPSDERAALVWAELTSGGKAAGRLRSPLDMVVAFVAAANGCVVVTGNEKGFAGLEIVKPLPGRLRGARSHSHSMVPGGLEVMS